MENIIFYLIGLIILVLALLSWIAYLYGKKNYITQQFFDENTKAVRLEGDKRALISELGLTKLELSRNKNELEKVNDKISELQTAAFENETTHNIKAELLKGYEQTISEQSKLLKKQADEITIQKEAIESLTNANKHKTEIGKDLSFSNEFNSVKIEKVHKLTDEYKNRKKDTKTVTLKDTGEFYNNPKK